MADDTSNTPASPTNESIAFDRAEFDAPESVNYTCAVCRRPITDQYHTANQKHFCTACTARLRNELDAANSRPALLRATGWGSLAALGGAIAWILIARATGYEIGLVAVLLGYVVGKSVRRGSGGVGGKRFQILAVSLTFLAITIAHVPEVLKGLEQAGQHTHAQPSSDEMAPRSDSPPSTSTQTASSHPKPSLGGFLLALLIVFVIAAIAPFLGLPQSIMGVVILGIALYEAWKFTRALPIEIAGPFEIPRSEPAAIAAPTGTSG